MRAWLAERVTSLLAVKHEGRLLPPGAQTAFARTEADGTEVALISNGDSFDLFVGRQSMVTVSLSPATVIALGRWIVSWWVKRTLFGLKLRLWDWGVIVRAEAAKRRIDAARAAARANTVSDFVGAKDHRK